MSSDKIKNKGFIGLIFLNIWYAPKSEKQTFQTTSFTVRSLCNSPTRQKWRNWGTPGNFSTPALLSQCYAGTEVNYPFNIRCHVSGGKVVVLFTFLTMQSNWNIGVRMVDVIVSRSNFLTETDNLNTFGMLQHVVFQCWYKKKTIVYYLRLYELINEEVWKSKRYF